MSAAASGPLRILLSALVQATEDEEKVRTAITNLIPEDAKDNLRIERIKLRGHYHNPLIRLDARLTHRAHVRHTLESIGQRLPEEDRKQLAKTFTARIDRKGQLFLRLDKQESYQGRIRIINRGDSIRLMIRFAGRQLSIDNLKDQCRQLNLI